MLPKPLAGNGVALAVGGGMRMPVALGGAGPVAGPQAVRSDIASTNKYSCKRMFDFLARLSSPINREALAALIAVALQRFQDDWLREFRRLQFIDFDGFAFEQFVVLKEAA